MVRSQHSIVHHPSFHSDGVCVIPKQLNARTVNRIIESSRNRFWKGNGVLCIKLKNSRKCSKIKAGPKRIGSESDRGIPISKRPFDSESTESADAVKPKTWHENSMVTVMRVVWPGLAWANDSLTSGASAGVRLRA